MSTNYSSQSNKTINVIIVKIIATITAPNSSAMLTILSSPQSSMYNK